MAEKTPTRSGTMKGWPAIFKIPLTPKNNPTASKIKQNPMIKSAKIRLLLKALALLLRAARALLLAAAERAAAPETLPFFCGLPKAPAPFFLCLSINVPLSRRQPHKLHLLTLESATPSPLNTSQTFSEPLSPAAGWSYPLRRFLKAPPGP